MKVKEIIKELANYNPEAKIVVVAHCKQYNFSLSFGEAEGVEKENCQTVSFYVDELCTNEQVNKND